MYLPLASNNCEKLDEYRNWVLCVCENGYVGGIFKDTPDNLNMIVFTNKLIIHLIDRQGNNEKMINNNRLAKVLHLMSSQLIVRFPQTSSRQFHKKIKMNRPTE